VEILAAESQQQELSSLRERVAVVEQSTKSAHLRIDNIQEQTQAIIEMSASIRYMAKQVEETVSILKEHDSRLETLEKLPGDNVVKALKVLLTLFIGALISYLFRRGL
jgi:hypothetical protein